MNVKEALKIDATPSHLISETEAARADGFLDAIDQLKATGVKEALESSLNACCGFDPIAGDFCLSCRTRGSPHALAKLKALLGEREGCGCSHYSDIPEACKFCRPDLEEEKP